VVSNLVSNALKYGPPARPVRVVVDGTGADLALAVSDEGESLAAQDREAIFEPFQSRRAAQGAMRSSVGLGLFIVRRIAEAHGGSVELDVARARGTTFTVRLPRGRSPAGAPPTPGG
jgi:signal transduction histidine kinase